MGGLFEELCKGPVVVVDDQIGTGDPIDRLIVEIEDRKLPVLSYKSIAEVRDRLTGLLFCNFILLDWAFGGGDDEILSGVRIGAEGEAISQEEVIEFIRAVQEISLAPIFVLSAYNIDEIASKLENAGVNTTGRKSVFVESKNTLCQSGGGLISKIEDWIKGSPHIYLGKWWTNEWLSRNTRVFWDLYQSNPDWPAWFYRSFKEDGDEPVLALRDTLFQLILSEIDVSSIDESLLDKETGAIDSGSLGSLKELYKILVYTTNNIERDIRPGDIFKIEENGEKKYYLNIRPECDTTKRTRNPELYLLEGRIGTFDEVQYDREYRIIIEKANQIIMHLLDGEDIVIFDKRKLSIKKYNSIKNQKIYRVVRPFITRYQQSFASYLGRFGVPTYPKEIIASFFKKQNG